MVIIGLLLIPTGYAMLTQNLVLAAACVAGILVVRFVGFSRKDSDDDA